MVVGGVVTTGRFVGTGVGYTRTALIGAGTAGRGLTTFFGRGCWCPVSPVVSKIAFCMLLIAGCGVAQEPV